MITDPIADMLARIRNAYQAGKKEVAVPNSKMKKALADILTKQQFIDEATVNGDREKALIIKLRYINNQPAIRQLRRISRPGRRVYVNKFSIPRVLGGIGKAVLSTPKGLMVDSEARKKHIGGEVVCTIW